MDPAQHAERIATTVRDHITLMQRNADMLAEIANVALHERALFRQALKAAADLLGTDNPARLEHDRFKAAAQIHALLEPAASTED